MKNGSDCQKEEKMETKHDVIRSRAWKRRFLKKTWDGCLRKGAIRTFRFSSQKHVAATTKMELQTKLGQEIKKVGQAGRSPVGGSCKHSSETGDKKSTKGGKGVAKGLGPLKREECK